MRYQSVQLFELWVVIFVAASLDAQAGTDRSYCADVMSDMTHASSWSRCNVGGTSHWQKKNVDDAC
jgi:hypothetical protein